ncbi:MAG: FixH family protein [Desulfamplus sp.]|nr:FixH family protein [Desulfamplus sp.]
MNNQKIILRADQILRTNPKNLSAINSIHQNSIFAINLRSMSKINQKILSLIMGTIIFFCMMTFTQKALAQDDVFTPLPGEGKKCKIGEDYYFEYSFDKTPQLGTVILKIQVFDRDGNKETSLKIAGDAGMPTMRGHHDTGMVEFQKNQKGDYLLPVNIVMPGEWDIRIIFSKDDKPIYKGSINFSV